MSIDRRDFVRTTALVGASLVGSPALARPEAAGAARPRSGRQARGSAARMKLSFKPFTAQLRHVFTIATSSRSTTPDMLTEIEYDGVVGYGEA